MPEITKQNALRWLDKQRSIVNDMVVNLPQDEQRKLLPELQVINAIAERVRELTAVEYLETKIAMCEAVWNDANEDYDCCDGCDLYDPETERYCGYFEHNSPRLAVETVKKWKEEHK